MTHIAPHEFFDFSLVGAAARNSKISAHKSGEQHQTAA
jgi:hypothetical protein